MTLNPLRTLAGRMVLVTILAVLISNLIAFAIFANERGASIRRAAESAIADRVAYTYQRLAEAPPEQRPALARSIRDFGIDYTLDSAPRVNEAARRGTAGRVAALLVERLEGADIRVSARLAEGPSRRWGVYLRWKDEYRGEVREGRIDHRPRDPPGADRQRPEGPPIVRFTQINVSAPLDGAWLNASAHLPGPRPAPTSLIIAGAFTILVVGLGAALISLQVGRPLAELAGAARRLGAGEPNVSAPVHGPEDVRRASTAFNAMAERLGRQLNRQRQMLWALSHDLRTPITALRLRAELIEDESARQRLLGPIAEMEALTEQALSLARAGASEEQRSSVDLAEIARTLCGELQDMGVNISAEAPAPVIAPCRPSEIARALRNLAENAARYGGGGIMRVRREASDAIIDIIDDGPGVPPDLLARLSEPFFRADSARGETSNGAGLGLAIAQAIAESHGGKLILENRTPRGFSAKLVLPT